MKQTFLVCCAIFLAFASTGLVIKTDPAFAQQAAEEMEEIVVEAPVVSRRVGRAGVTGAPIELIELKRRVSFADLDVSKQADVIELETRIETTATESCEKLANMFPLTNRVDPGEKRRCITKAVDSADEQVQAAIAAAK